VRHWEHSGKAQGYTLWLVLGGVLAMFIAVTLLARRSAADRVHPGRSRAAMMISIALVTGISTIFSSATQSINKAEH
jgi:Flp pilus assembly pilin Flp